MKKWEILKSDQRSAISDKPEDIIKILLENRGIKTKKEIEQFLYPKDPSKLTAQDLEIDSSNLTNAILRLRKAIDEHESVVVYADYDADGITAGAIMWQVLHALGAKVMPYIPHRVDEGYGLSEKGIDNVKEKYNPTLIVTVDHGITAYEKVEYAKKLGIEVIVTDHHVKPEKLPDCTIVHTTQISGAGVSWFVAKELLSQSPNLPISQSLLELAAIGIIADLLPLVGANRSIVKYGLLALNQTKSLGLLAIMTEARLSSGEITAYDISHVISPRLNAMGRLVHAMDALRLLCTKQKIQAEELASKLGLTNKERQQLTVETTAHALKMVTNNSKKIIFISSVEYNQGIIGLVAGKLVEEYYLPAIVLSKGEIFSKASARSIFGFNIIEAIRSCSELLVDAGGHPMAAGFTVETKYLSQLQEMLENIANEKLNEELLTRKLKIDLELPFKLINIDLWKNLQALAPFGFGNSEPVFMLRNVKSINTKLVGANQKHLKFQIIAPDNTKIDAIAFGFGEYYDKLSNNNNFDIAFSLDLNKWNGNEKLQLKIKDLRVYS